MIFLLKAQPYSVSVLFAINVTDAQVMDYAKRHLGPTAVLELGELHTEGTTFTGRTTHFDSGAICIRIKDEVTTPRAMAVLAHEVYHAVCFICRWVGIEQSEATEEAYAYLLEDLLVQAFRRIGAKHWTG